MKLWKLALAAAIVSVTPPALAQTISVTPLGGSNPRRPLFKVETIPEALDWVVHEQWLLYHAVSPGHATRTLHLRDLPSGKTIDLGYETVWPVQFSAGPHAILNVPEAGVGDLDGDGDEYDVVFFHLDLATGALENSGVERVAFYVPSIISGDWAFLGLKEKLGHDLNGDGDYLDTVIQAWDLRSPGLPFNTGVAASPIDWVTHESFLLFQTLEDGNHLHVYDAATAQHVDTGIPVLEFQASGPHSVLIVPETDTSWSSHDLNGDGDSDDLVIHVFDAESGVLENLALAVKTPPRIDLRSGSYVPDRFQMNAARVAFFVGESEQGGLDLDGDGDALDHVLFVHDFASGVTTSVGLAAWGYTLDDEVLVLQADEQEQSADLDGDGDQDDKVLHVLNLSNGSTWNTGIELCGGVTLPLELAIHGPMVAFASGAGCQSRLADASAETVATLGTWPERAWSGGLLELVAAHRLAFYQPESHQILTQRILVNSIYPVSTGNAHPGAVFETVAGHDLNGDGDVSDMVLRVVRTLF